jgi:hypothetical protein
VRELQQKAVKEGAMSIHAISSSQQLQQSQNLTSPGKLQQFQEEFQQLGQDLQSGNLSGAQADLTGLQQLGPGLSSSANNPITQAFDQLSEQLQSGDLSGAEQDYSSIQQDFSGHGGGSHHPWPVNGTPSTPVGEPALDLRGTGGLTSTQQLAYGGGVAQSLLPSFTVSGDGAPSSSAGISLIA